jgi:hypothetical protein
MTTAADALEARAGQLDAIAAVVRRKTDVEQEFRAELVELWESTPMAERRFVADELAIVLAESSRTTQRWVETALCQTTQPELQALVDSGVWSTRHADAVMDVLGCVAPQHRQQVLDLVLGQQAARTPYQLKNAVMAAMYLVDPEAMEKAAEKTKKDRSVTATDYSDGSAGLFMHGTKAAIAAAMASLDALAVKAGPEDCRTLLQRRFDTMMLLLTGQLTAVGAQVQLLINLSTLEGGDAPAEIPGFGLVTASEARELVTEADSIRRVVVDDAGQLVSVDGTVESPLAQPAQEQPVLLSDEVEPAEVTGAALADEADDLAHTLSDEQWLAEVLDDVCDPEIARRRAAQDLYDLSHPCPGPVDTPEQQAAQAQLRALLVVLAEQETVTGRRAGDAHVRIQADGSLHIHYPHDPRDPDPGRGPDGGGTDPPSGPTWPLPAGYVDDHHAMYLRDADLPLPLDERERASTLRRRWLGRQFPSWHVPLPPEPAEVTRRWPAPTARDLDWWAGHPDRTLAHTLIQQSVPVSALAPPPPGGWPSIPSPRPVWEATQLHSVTAKLLVRPVSPLPPDSSSYPFRGALARYLKMRDQTCRFPSCPRLAQHCDCDHRIVWPLGPTSVINGVCECEHHHQCKHAIMTLTRLADGTLRWTLPTGHYADSPPRPLIRGW